MFVAPGSGATVTLESADVTDAAGDVTSVGDVAGADTAGRDWLGPIFRPHQTYKHINGLEKQQNSLKILFVIVGSVGAEGIA